ncbi:MAG: CoA transferase [Thermaerobacter sp.]|nr:CoA transferase [Thermaerobacter sp.]
MLPLEDVVVLDLSRILTGPYCTMMLADFGAEVVKIEPPAGDDTRAWGPPFIEGESAYFLSVNRNKRSIVMDFQIERDRARFRRMVRSADVVVENYRPGTLNKWGFDYPQLAAINPRIILASISGFGATGPGRDRPGYDVVAQAMSGLMSVTGDGGRPTKAGFSVADIGAGMWAAFGIMTALWARRRTGRGQWVDTSLYETLVSWQTYQAGNFFATGQVPRALGSAHPNIAPYQAVRARDGYFILACGNDGLWRTLVKVAPVPFGDEEEFMTNAQRVMHRQELISRLEEEVFAAADVKDWVERLGAAGIPVAPIQDLAETWQDPQLLSRGMLAVLNHPMAGNIKTVGIPVKLSDTPGSLREAPPLLDQHRTEILDRFGLDPDPS